MSPEVAVEFEVREEDDGFVVVAHLALEGATIEAPADCSSGRDEASLGTEVVLLSADRAVLRLPVNADWECQFGRGGDLQSLVTGESREPRRIVPSGGRRLVPTSGVKKPIGGRTLVRTSAVKG